MNPWFANLLAESRFLARYPQYASVLAQFEPLGISEVPIMAVALHRPLDANPIVRLYVNVDYFEKHPLYFPGILLHEIHHVVFRHVSDERFHCVAHPQMMELAMELAANEGIRETLPSPLRWEEFQEFGIRERQSTMHRYRLLCEAHRQGRLSVLGEDQLDASDPSWRKRQAPADASHQGPRILIMPSKRSLLPWKNLPRVLSSPMLADHRPGQSGHSGDTGLGDALDRRSQDPREATWSHGFGGSFPTDTATIQRWRLLIRQHLRGDKGGGDLDRSGSGPRIAKELPRHLAWTSERCPHLAWGRILRFVLRTRRVVHPSYLRPNRRFPDRIGELPGRARHMPRPALLVGVDTSASMSDETLGRIQQELRILARYARVTVAESDASVHRVYPLRSTAEVLGGGDTDFHPLFALADASLRTFDAILHFTDGKGIWPTAAPSLPVLWVLTNDHAFDCPWGTVVRLSSS